MSQPTPPFRVGIVGAGGKLQGYAGGLELKARLLALESGSPRDGWLL